MCKPNGVAPHVCGDCGEPAYHGFNMPGICVQKGCAFYSEDLWVEWVLTLPDVPDPVTDFEDEDTSPGYHLDDLLDDLLDDALGPIGNYLDVDARLMGITRRLFESDKDLRLRIMDAARSKP